MKKLLSLLLILVFSLSIISPVLAESLPTGRQASKSGVIKREKIEEKRENIQEKMATREAALKEKLAKFKDQKKAQRVDKINAELARINKQRTDQMLKFLDNAERILGKVPSGSTSAQAKIDKAKVAVNLQADKDYTITATSEAKIKNEVKEAHQALKTDLQNLKKLITEAKQAVIRVIREAASGK